MREQELNRNFDRSILILASLMATLSSPTAADPNAAIAPWKASESIIVIDAYGPNRLDISSVREDQKVGGVIHKASSGRSIHEPQTFSQRRSETKKAGLRWGSYHLLTNDTPIKLQIDTYMDAATPDDDELLAIDVECLDSSHSCAKKRFRVTPDQVRTAITYLHEKYGRNAIVYANHSVTKVLAAVFEQSPPPYKPPLWYARFKSNISGVFPMSYWNNYGLWQFSSEINCTREKHKTGKCLYKVPGTNHDIDVNVFTGTQQEFDQFWASK